MAKKTDSQDAKRAALAAQMADLSDQIFSADMEKQGVVMTFNEVATHARLSRSAMYKLIDDPTSGFPPPLKILGEKGKTGGKVVFFRAMVDAWLLNQLVASAEPDALAAALHLMVKQTTAPHESGNGVWGMTDAHDLARRRAPRRTEE